MKRHPGALLDLLAAYQLRTHTVLSVGPHAGDPHIIGDRSFAWLGGSSSERLLAFQLESNTELAALRAGWSAEQCNQRMRRIRHHRRVALYSRSDLKTRGILGRLFGFVVAGSHTNGRRVFEQFGGPGEIAALAEVPDNPKRSVVDADRVAEDVHSLGRVFDTRREANRGAHRLRRRHSRTQMNRQGRRGGAATKPGRRYETQDR